MRVVSGWWRRRRWRSRLAYLVLFAVLVAATGSYVVSIEAVLEEEAAEPRATLMATPTQRRSLLPVGTPTPSPTPTLQPTPTQAPLPASPTPTVAPAGSPTAVTPTVHAR